MDLELIVNPFISKRPGIPINDKVMIQICCNNCLTITKFVANQLE